MREAMPHLKASKRGRVVNIASDAGKTRLRAARRLLRVEVRGRRPDPGGRRRGRARRRPGQRRLPRHRRRNRHGTGGDRAEDRARLRAARRRRSCARGAESFPLKRVGTVADVVSATLFLISESSNWITGESINVDGGSLAG